MPNDLYPMPNEGEIERGTLDVGDGHTLYYEVSGNTDGMPIIFLHGGPGGGCSFKEHQYFDPEFYKIILIDQRGAGKSTPYASVDYNTPEHLVSDLETLREHLDIEEWALVGGSWGSCLALLYTIKYPDRVIRLLLRGLFFGDFKGAQNIIEEWGAAQIQPDYFEQYAAAPFVPKDARHNLTRMYADIFEYGDEATQIDAAMRFHVWDHSIAYAHIDAPGIQRIQQKPNASLAISKIFFHFTLNAFAVNDYKQRIFDAGEILSAIPIDVIHGECDWICPMQNAKEFGRVYPHANINIVLGAGHTVGDELIRGAMMQTLIRWSEE